MSEFNFPLKTNLIVPAKGDLRRGYFLFPAVEFGLTYQVVPNFRSKTIVISLQVVHMESNELVWDLGTWNISEDGFTVKDTEGNEVVINRYSDVIKYFNGDGSLTVDGIEWAKTTSFAGAKLGDFI